MILRFASVMIVTALLPWALKAPASVVVVELSKNLRERDCSQALQRHAEAAVAMAVPARGAATRGAPRLGYVSEALRLDEALLRAGLGMSNTLPMIGPIHDAAEQIRQRQRETFAGDTITRVFTDRASFPFALCALTADCDPQVDLPHLVAGGRRRIFAGSQKVTEAEWGTPDLILFQAFSGVPSPNALNDWIRKIFYHSAYSVGTRELEQLVTTPALSGRDVLRAAYVERGKTGEVVSDRLAKLYLLTRSEFAEREFARAMGLEDFSRERVAEGLLAELAHDAAASAEIAALEITPQNLYSTMWGLHRLMLRRTIADPGDQALFAPDYLASIAGTQLRFESRAGLDVSEYLESHGGLAKLDRAPEDLTPIELQPVDEIEARLFRVLRPKFFRGSPTRLFFPPGASEPHVLLEDDSDLTRSVGITSLELWDQLRRDGARTGNELRLALLVPDVMSVIYDLAIESWTRLNPEYGRELTREAVREEGLSLERLTDFFYLVLRGRLDAFRWALRLGGIAPSSGHHRSARNYARYVEHMLQAYTQTALIFLNDRLMEARIEHATDRKAALMAQIAAMDPRAIKRALCERLPPDAFPSLSAGEMFEAFERLAPH